VAFDVVVKAFFTDSGLSAGLATANDQLQRLKKSGPDAAMGVRGVEQGVRMLAFQAAGLPGPLGRIAAGLLQLGGGNALVLGVVAGVGAIGLAIRLMSQDARDNAAAQEEMLKKLGQLGPHAQATAARIRIAELERLRDTPTLLERGGTLVKGLLGPALGGASLAEQRQAIERQIAEQKMLLGSALGTVAKPGQEAQRGANLQVREALSRNVLGVDQGTDTAVTERIRRLRLEYEHIPPALAAVIAATERHAAELTLASTATRAAQEQTDEATIRNQMLGASEEAVTEALRRHKLELQGMAPALAAQVAGQERAAASNIKSANVLRTQLPQAFGAIAAAATQGFANMAQTIVQQFAGIVANLPGISPVGAGILGIVGSLFGSLFGGGHKDPVPVKVTNPEDFNRGPDRVTEIIVSPGGEELRRTRYEISRRARLDATDRSGG
jgi:hypothetical protein